MVTQAEKISQSFLMWLNSVNQLLKIKLLFLCNVMKYNEVQILFTTDPVFVNTFDYAVSKTVTLKCVLYCTKLDLKNTLNIQQIQFIFI